MGDMKTPDFDDLLAAFDIPDIDAKEAIQSSPEEERHEPRANADETESGSPSCFPCPPALHSDPPVVSVIVKNTVRSFEDEEEEKSNRNKTDNPSSSGLNSQVQVKFADLTSHLGPQTPADSPVEPQVANGIEGSVPRDQEQSDAEPWPHRSPLRSTLNEDDNGVQVGSAQQTTDVINTLKPLLYPQSSPSAGPNSSTPPSPHSVSPQLSPHSPLKEESHVSSKPSSPLPRNGSMKAGIKRVMHSDDDDSEPDLVIQESPESVMSSPPQFKRRAKVRRPDMFGSPETSSAFVSDHSHLSSVANEKPKPQPEDERSPTTKSSPSKAPPLQSQTLHCNAAVSMDSAPVKEEKYPEHVIDERDSPESPPPSETGLLVHRRGSDSAQTSDLSAGQKDELMGSGPREEDRPADSVELSEKVTGDQGNVNKESCSAVTQAPAEKVSPPLRPLKVKIKMQKGSITRTVKGVTPKRGGRTTTKGVISSKPSPELRNTRSKRELPEQSQIPAMSVLQEGPRTVRDKIAMDTKPKVSPTAVSITKSAALPSITVSSPRAGMGGMNPRSLGPKSLTLPPPSPLLHPQGSSRPASIVNSTGAIISKSQTNLVEAFNKILNNKNLLPCYKPDLSSPLPAEWGLPLPAQVIYYYYLLSISTEQKQLVNWHWN